MNILDAMGRPILIPDSEVISDPKPGEIWVYGHDGEDLGVALIVAVSSFHVTAWPATSRVIGAGAPTLGLRIEGGWEYSIWPEAEFGLSLASLDRCLFRILSGAEVMELRISGYLETDHKGVEVPAWSADISELLELDAVCRQVWQLAEWSWPPQDDRGLVFNPEAAKRLDGRKIGKALNLRPGKVASLLEGEVVVSSQILRILHETEEFNIKDQELLEPIGGVDAKSVILPRYKSQVKKLIDRKTINEVAVRNLVWERAVSARNRIDRKMDDVAASHIRIQNAFDSLLAEGE